MTKIAPSILSADFAKLGEDIAVVEKAGADYLHFDVMDGCFVPNISIGVPVLESVRKITDMVLDVHLMIDHPTKYIDTFCNKGADILTIHLEAESGDEVMKDLKRIRELGKKSGLSIKPGTPFSAALPYLPYTDLLLIMTVEPGFGGQKFMYDMLPKITEAAEYISSNGLNCEISVDGGINSETVIPAKKAGANVIVSGSTIFKAASKKECIDSLRNC